jgi:predicted enzyme related to lactoylglutathione lyase
MSSASTTQAIFHISVVTINVSDQDAALRFYTECLGFEKRMDAPMGEGLRWLTVAPAGATTEIVLSHGFGEGGAPLGKNTGLVLETEDIDAAYRELAGRGVRFTKEPSREFFGGWAEFVDQDGNAFGLHSNQTAG